MLDESGMVVTFLAQMMANLCWLGGRPRHAIQVLLQAKEEGFQVGCKSISEVASCCRFATKQTTATSKASSLRRSQ